jgi:hypothetical protein
MKDGIKKKKKRILSCWRLKLKKKYSIKKIKKTLTESTEINPSNLRL